MLARAHTGIVAVLLIIVCIAYSVLAVADPDVATALSLGFIAFVLMATVVLRLFRRV